MSGDSGADALPGSRSAREPERAIKPGRHGLPPETVAGIQRDRLIDAFVQVVAQHGYRNTTISRVTGAAGVTKKTFYAHFGDLDGCFLAAYERGTAIVLGRMGRAYANESSWAEGIRAALRAMLATMAAEPHFARVSLVEVNAAGPRVRRARIEYLHGFRGFFTDPAFDLEPVPVAVVDAIVGGVYSALYVRIESGETADLPALLPELTYFALLPLVGKEAAAPHLARRP
ncbi:MULTISPECIES: TetR/AcrR family transcriptional regulator [Actinomadura]|uniref:TetR/AcrR family transcriptional regulator n=1 Tax=Actinomadura yumaensis TaxID=111807 RepID=A0ABW2CTI2_9ACTN|nr:TetR/AcrR family transcriptional regulator [Actinomadura sp. J1-007]MWK36010.1 TetR family transcriptional regulator [Actinomadura sp. J1-007]